MCQKTVGQVCLKLARPLACSLVQQAPFSVSTCFSNMFLSASLAPQHLQQAGWLSAIHTSSAPCQSQQRDGHHDRQKTIHEQTQEVSKSFITSVLNMEEAWLSGVAGQLKMWAAAKKVPELQEQGDEQQRVVEQVRTVYLDTLQRAAAGRELSVRARSHLKQACLAAATHKVLLDLSPSSEKHVEEFIMFNLGGVYSSFMLGGLKLSSWAKKWLLRESSMSQAVDTLHTIARDMEGACHCSIQPLAAVSESDEESQQPHQQQQPPQQQEQEDRGDKHEEDAEAVAEQEAAKLHTQQQWQQGAALTVDSCMIAEVLQQEGVPQLLRYFCCQHNIAWLQAYDKQGVASNLEACIAKGDSCCRIIVEPKQ